MIKKLFLVALFALILVPSAFAANDISIAYSDLDGLGIYDFDLPNNQVFASRYGAVRQNIALPTTGKFHMEWKAYPGNPYYRVGVMDKSTTDERSAVAYTYMYYPRLKQSSLKKYNRLE